MNADKYEMIFKNAPIGIWEEDWSEIKIRLKILKEVIPLEAFKEYINNNFEIVRELANSIKIIRVNQKAIEMHESISEEEFLNAPIINTFNSVSIEAFKKQMVALYTGEKEFETETEMKTLKGNVLNVLLQVEFPDELNYHNVIVVMTDITPIKKATNQYIETKSKFHRSFYQGVVGMVMTDTNGNIIELNDTFCCLTKYNKDELSKTNICSLFEDPQSITTDMNKLIYDESEDSTLKCEKQILNKLGIKTWVYMGLSLIKNEVGNPLYFIGQTIDIDAEKKISLLLETNVHKYQQLLDSTNAIYLILNENSDIIECSLSFNELLGNKNLPSYFHKRPFRAFVSSESIYQYDVAWKNIMLGKTISNVEISLTKDSVFKWVSMNASMLQNGGKKIFVLLTDISVKKRLEIEKTILKEKRRDKLKNNIRDLRASIENYGKK